MLTSKVIFELNRRKPSGIGIGAECIAGLKEADFELHVELIEDIIQSDNEVKFRPQIGIDSIGAEL